MHKAHATRLVNNNKLHQTSCKNSIGNYQIWSMYPVDVEPALSGIGAWVVLRILLQFWGENKHKNGSVFNNDTKV